MLNFDLITLLLNMAEEDAAFSPFRSCNGLIFTFVVDSLFQLYPLSIGDLDLVFHVGPISQADM